MFHITFHSNLKFNKKTKKEERVTINSKPSFTRNKILQEPLYFTIGRFTSTLRPFVTPDVLHSIPFLSFPFFFFFKSKFIFHVVYRHHPFLPLLNYTILTNSSNSSYNYDYIRIQNFQILRIIL